MPTTLDQHRAVNIGQYDIEGLSNIDVWPHIIGGQNATEPHMFPWFARLIRYGSCVHGERPSKTPYERHCRSCGASLISKRLAASAFHCLQKQIWNEEDGREKFEPPTLCNPDPADQDYFFGAVILGTNIIDFRDGVNCPNWNRARGNYRHLEIQRVYAPMYGGEEWKEQHGPEREYGHDFALIHLKEPVRDEWRDTGINQDPVSNSTKNQKFSPLF